MALESRPLALRLSECSSGVRRSEEDRGADEPSGAEDEEESDVFGVPWIPEGPDPLTQAD